MVLVFGRIWLWWIDWIQCFVLFLVLDDSV